MCVFSSFSGTAPAVDFESTGFSAGRMVKKGGAVSPEYHVNDYLCSVRVVADADLHLGEHRSIEYNKAWKQFFEDNPNPTIDQLFNQAKILMKEIYGNEVF